jgi:hypothetical protein
VKKGTWLEKTWRTGNLKWFAHGDWDLQGWSLLLDLFVHSGTLDLSVLCFRLHLCWWHEPPKRR